MTGPWGIGELTGSVSNAVNTVTRRQEHARRGASVGRHSRGGTQAKSKFEQARLFRPVRYHMTSLGDCQFATVETRTDYVCIS
jgi:hypothetical protein